MALSSTCSTWVLPLLLLSLSICFHQSSSQRRTTTRANSCALNEFNINVRDLKVALENCSESCSLVPISDKTCQCFNLSMPQKGRVFPSYFIRGLESLHLKPGRDESAAKGLIKTLTKRFKHFEIKDDALQIKNETIISPKSFKNSLEHVAKLINTKCA